jgi:hypothetical protein
VSVRIRAASGRYPEPIREANICLSHKRSFGFCLQRSIKKFNKTLGEIIAIFLIVIPQFTVRIQSIRRKRFLARPKIIVEDSSAIEKESVSPRA